MGRSRRLRPRIHRPGPAYSFWDLRRADDPRADTRERVFESRPQDPAIVAALQARQLREEAKAIAARDANLARERRIGRPDLPRQFDDGGLGDVNHAPVSAMVHLLGLSEADATQVIEARDRIGGLSSPEELIAYTDLSPTLVDSVRERLVFLP